MQQQKTQMEWELLRNRLEPFTTRFFVLLSYFCIFLLQYLKHNFEIPTHLYIYIYVLYIIYVFYHPDCLFSSPTAYVAPENIITSFPQNLCELHYLMLRMFCPQALQLPPSSALSHRSPSLTVSGCHFMLMQIN